MVVPVWMGAGRTEQQGGLLGFSQHPGTSWRGVGHLPKGKAVLEPVGRTEAGRPHAAWVPPSASRAQTPSPNNVCWML